MDYNITYREKDKGIQFIISYKDDTGKWRQKSKQGFTKKAEAKRAADKMLEKLKKDMTIKLNLEHDGITFKEYVKIFMADKELVVEQNTIKAYKHALKWFEILESKGVADIQHIHVMSCINEMIKQGLKRDTIKSYLTKINHIFEMAIDPYKIIPTNPIGRINLPEEKRNKKMKALNKIELDDLLNRISPEKDYIILLLASTCGLRLGEIIGLSWSNVDFNNNLLSVTKQWKKLKSGTYGIGTVKERRSQRSIPLPLNTKKALEEYKRNNPTDTLNRIILENNNDTVSSRMWFKFRRLGYEISLHDLRHTYATMLLSSGLDYHTVAELLGDTLQIVMERYSHVNSDMINIATKKINAIF